MSDAKFKSMPNFSIFTQVQKEVEDFDRQFIKQGSLISESARYLGKESKGMLFNQRQTIALIDLYFASQFETGKFDTQKQRKIFINKGKFRTEVASKQIDLDFKDFRFIPDDYADPWRGSFIQKEFSDWGRDSHFSEMLNESVEWFPRYGTIVGKKVGKSIELVPIQNIIIQQDAKDMQTASYVIETHAEMTPEDIYAMEAGGWNLEGLDMKYGETVDVYERYGYVPKDWYNRNKLESDAEAEEEFVHCVVIVAPKVSSRSTRGHIFYVNKVKEGNRPYREAHWSRRHGRWLGVGVMEDLFENQVAANIVANLKKRQLAWSAKKVWKTSDPNAPKNLAAEVPDGAVLQLGLNGDITQVDMTSKSTAEIDNFMRMVESDADQQAFTYEVATGEALPSGTPFRLGVLLSNTVNSHFKLKQEKLGIFWKSILLDFMVPQFLREIDVDRVLVAYSDEPGFEALKAAGVQYFRTQLIKASLVSGKSVDAAILAAKLEPILLMKELLFKLDGGSYKDFKYKIKLVVTGEEVDLQKKVETLTTIYQTMLQQADSRAEKVLERIAALTGENLATFGTPQPRQPAPTASTTPVTPTANVQ